MANRKMSDVARQRITLYAAVLGFIVLCSFAANVIIPMGVARTGKKVGFVYTVDEIDAPHDIAAFMEGASRKWRFGGETVTEWLEEGLPVAADASPDEAAPELYLITGADTAGYIAYNAAGERVPLPDTIYRVYLAD